MNLHRVPDGLPVLSRGSHRNPRKGACFMEMASVLADEPWSDHPQCTHPLLAQLARLVNDYTSDANRGRLAVLIPDVVGLHGGGLSWEVTLTATIAADALPDVPEPLQRALAAGLVRCEQLGTPEDRPLIRAALDRVPGAEKWARRFTDGTEPLRGKAFQKRSAPTVMRCAVRGLAISTVHDRDGRLRELLEVGIATARTIPVVAADVLPPAPPRRHLIGRSSSA